MKRRRYLVKPHFCAPFVVWAESKALARRYGSHWLGRTIPVGTPVLVFLTHDKLSCMLDAHDRHQPTHANTIKQEAFA